MKVSIPSRLSWTSVVVAVAATAAGPAFAQQSGVSADPELVFTRLGHDQIPGIPVPAHDVRNTVRAGMLFQYQLNPVTGYQLDEWAGNVVVNRFAGQLGVSWDFSKYGAVRFVLPFAVNSGSQVPELATGEADSGYTIGAMGDIFVGLSATPLQSRFFNLGVHGDLWVPSGTRNVYVGDGSVRVNAGVSGMIKFWEYFDLVLDASVLARRYLDTGQDFQVGPELWLSEGARLKLPWIPVQVTQTLVSRGGFTNFFQGGAENSLEILGGVRVPIDNIAYNTGMAIDVQAGRGVNQGYGTTDFRLVAGLTFIRNPGRKPVPEEVAVVEVPPPYIPPPVIEDEPPPPEPTWEEGQVAMRVYDQIVIRDPIEFFVDTADIKPESQPILTQVADIINDDWRIRHVVIEGHASAEGDFAYNYELSTRRAESIFKQLILNGVAPERISYKGYGEVRPKVEGDTEEAWSVNRRVEFEIVGQFQEDEPNVPDTYGEDTLLPWNGGTGKLKNPKSRTEIQAEKKAAEEAAKKAAEKEEVKRDRFTDDEADDIEFEPKRERPAKEEPPLPSTNFNLDEDEDEQPAPAEPAPAEPAPADPAPSEPAPAEPAPAETEPAQPSGEQP